MVASNFLLLVQKELHWHRLFLGILDTAVEHQLHLWPYLASNNLVYICACKGLCRCYCKSSHDALKLYFGFFFWYGSSHDTSTASIIIIFLWWLWSLWVPPCLSKKKAEEGLDNRLLPIPLIYDLIKDEVRCCSSECIFDYFYFRNIIPDFGFGC